MARINERSFDDKLLSGLDEQEEKLMIEEQNESGEKEVLIDVLKYPRNMDMISSPWSNYGP